MNENRSTKPREGAPRRYALQLFVASMTPRSQRALDRITEICESNLRGRYDLEVVDLLAEPQRAVSDQILAVPTLVRQAPLPHRRVIGDLSNTERVLVGLDLRT